MGAGNTSEKTEYEYIDRFLNNHVQYWYQVADVDQNGNQNIHGPVSAITVEETIYHKETDLPQDYHLWQNFPNPFNPETIIRLSLPESKGPDEQITISVYSISGQKVKTLFEGSKTAGMHSFLWDGTDEAGKNLAGGIYYYQVKSSHYQKTCKMILLR